MEAGDPALLPESDLVRAGEGCEMAFLLVPHRDGADTMLERLGLGWGTAGAAPGPRRDHLCSPA